MDAFATFQDLGSRLNRVFAPEEQSWITDLLEDASTYLRDDVIGQQVYPQEASTFSAWPDAGVVELPQHPVVSVSSVTTGGEPVDFVLKNGVVHVGTDDQVEVTFTFGYSSPPESLKRWACVLVSQALIPLELKLGLTVGGLSSVQIDDFRAAFADAGEGTGMTLSDRNIELIRRQFGGPGTHVVGLR